MATSYIITIGGENFTLKLNQEEHSTKELRIISKIIFDIEHKINKKIILLKEPNFDYDADQKILAAIKERIVFSASSI